jgi:hypothetical protein
LQTPPKIATNMSIQKSLSCGVLKQEKCNQTKEERVGFGVSILLIM